MGEVLDLIQEKQNRHGTHMTGIEIQIIWFDIDVIELRITGSNGRFSGATEVYAGYDALPEMAEALRGFPKLIPDTRVLELGKLGSDPVQEGLRLCFRCVDSWGHAVAEMRVRSNPIYGTRHAEYAEFVIPVEPHAIDSFARRLEGMEVAIGAVASLPGAT